MISSLSRTLVLLAGTVFSSDGGGSSGLPVETSTRERILMDADWRFALGHATDPARDFDPIPTGTHFSYFAKAGWALGAAAEKFDDSGWKPVDLPHDWAVALPFSEKGSGSHGFKAIGKNFPENSVGWYRKHFDLPAADRGKRIWLDFEGVFRDSQVWVNGFFLGRETSGYSSFGYDISDYVNFGGSNLIVVRVNATDEEGWWYEGAGIYRHVWLTKVDPVHVARWGTFVSSTVGRGSATLKLQATVENSADATADYRVRHEILDPAGRCVAEVASKPGRLGPGESATVTTKTQVTQPELWSLEHPNLYSMVTLVEQGGRTVDRYVTPFGIRSIRWDANKGFFLNGKRTQLKGVCIHQDHAGVGVAIPDALDVWRLRQLKEMGVNALRTSHNMVAPALLDACDRLGILVMDENREVGINPHQLDSLRRLIVRDRNHPSVVIWSLGNEEWGIEGGDRGARITSTMQAFAKSLDPTRPTTIAISGGWGGGSSTTIDVMGFNYLTHGNVDEYHAKFPTKPSVATEDGATFTTRGVYFEDRGKGHLTAYDRNKVDWNTLAEESWNHYAARPFVAGQFQWTGFDYRGEPTPFGWPSIASQFGILDLCGFPKDNFYYYQGWWSDRPVLHILPHWNWAGREGQLIDVWVHGNDDEVELRLNGASLGRKAMPRNGHLEWKVPYAPGVLEAVGYRKGQVREVRRVETTGEPVALRLESQCTDGVWIVAVSAVDAQGRFVPTAQVPVTFEISGARLLGVGNGDPSSHEPDHLPARSLFNGRAQVILTSTPGATLTAHAPNLTSTTLPLTP